MLQRVVAVICLLEEGGLTFRGDDETFGSPNDGNFLGLPELIAKFDPYLLVMGRILGIGIENIGTFSGIGIGIGEL